MENPQSTLRRSTRLLHRSSSLADEDNEPRKSVRRLEPPVPPPSKKALFTFGVLADIQYAPIPDGHSYSGQPRYYRHALQAAKHAAQHFQREMVSLVLNLGDVIDGKCQDIVQHGGDALPKNVHPGHFSVDQVLQALQEYQHGPILHTYGNHELYNLNRHEIASKLKIPFVKEPCGDLVGYRSHVHQSIRFVVLDSYDVALMQRCPQTSQKHKEAASILQQHNPNYPQQENSPEGLNGNQKRFVAFNGAVGSVQLAWLRDTLSQARANGERVIVLSHQPILPGSSSPVCLVWNYQDVLEVLREFKDVVVASFSGHAHKGGYKRDTKSGIHFRVFEAVLESPHPHKTYGMVDVHDNCLVVRGYGYCESATYDFAHMPALSPV